MSSGRPLPVVLALVVVAACTTPAEDEQPSAATAVTVDCDKRYNQLGPNAATGGTTNRIEVRAELDTDLPVSSLGRVTAVACELATEPRDVDCPSGYVCARSPRPLCQQVPVAITEEGQFSATCGQRVEERNKENVLVTVREKLFATVTFYVPPAPAP